MSIEIAVAAEQMVAQGFVWSLKSADDTWAMHEDPESGDEAMPVWLDEAAALSSALGGWKHFAPARIDLVEFVNDWLPALDEEAAWVGFNFVADVQGDMFDPVELGNLLTTNGGIVSNPLPTGNGSHNRR
jgi:hypothetical protein